MGQPGVEKQKQKTSRETLAHAASLVIDKSCAQAAPSVLRHCQVHLAAQLRAPEVGLGSLRSGPCCGGGCLTVVGAIFKKSLRTATRERVNSGVAQWLACWARNPKVRGSKPRSAIALSNRMGRRQSHPGVRLPKGPWIETTLRYHTEVRFLRWTFWAGEQDPAAQSSC